MEVSFDDVWPCAVLRRLKVEIPAHLQRDRPCFEAITIQLLDRYGEAYEPPRFVLKWTRQADEGHDDSKTKKFKSSDKIGRNGVQPQHERARGDVPVLEANIPSGSRFLVSASLGPSPWAYARQHWDPSSALTGHVSTEERRALRRRWDSPEATSSAPTVGSTPSSGTSVLLGTSSRSGVVVAANATKDVGINSMNPRRIHHADIILSGVFMRRKHGWLTGAPKKYTVQVLRRTGNALIAADIMIGAGASCQHKGGAFVLTPSGPKGTSSGKTYTFTPVIDATTQFAETPEAICKLWAERLNSFIEKDEQQAQTDHSLILRLAEPSFSSAEDAGGQSVATGSERLSLNDSELELTREREIATSSARSVSMSSVQLQNAIHSTGNSLLGASNSTPSLKLEPHNAAEQEQYDERLELHQRRSIVGHYDRTREECVRLAAGHVHSHQLPEAIELVQHYMNMPGITTPARTTPSSVTSHVGGTQAFVNQVLGAVAELKDAKVQTSAQPVATACHALGQLLSTDPYNSSILGLLESLHAAHLSSQSKQLRRKAFDAPIDVDNSDGESQPGTSIDGGTGSSDGDAADPRRGHDKMDGAALKSRRHSVGNPVFQNDLIGEEDDPQAAYHQRNPHRNMQIWWRISASPDELLDLNDATLLDRRAMGESNLVSLPGGRLHVRDRENDPKTCAGGGATLRHATLRFRGNHKETDYALLSPGTEFTIQCQGLEEGAHEFTELDIIIRVVQPQSETDQSAVSGEFTNGTASVVSQSDAEQKSAEEKQRKATWPPLPFGRPPSVTELIFEIRRTAEQAAVRRLHRMYGYLGLNVEFETLQDSPSAPIVRTAAERFIYQQMIARLSKELRE
eukprot:COSAG02_NODE_748_length_17708_cov_8.490317_5_plen_857_part_00